LVARHENGVVERREVLVNLQAANSRVRAIRAVHGGDIWVGRRVLAHLLENLQAQIQAAHESAADPVPGLTSRETQVVVKIQLGMTNKEVARQLGISETTVKTHLQHIFHKLHISRRVELWNRALICAQAPLADSQ